MIPQSDNQVSTSLGNSGLSWTVSARNRDTAVPAEGNGDLQTLICVLVARPRRCLTLSNTVPWQNWMAAYLGYTLRMKTLFRVWQVMVHDTHMRRSRWRDPDNVSHCRILSPDKTEWQPISATLCGRRRCFVVDQLWFMTCMREEVGVAWPLHSEIKSSV